ncbi:MAG: hypothetical protein Q4A28_00295 [Brachymonas sp.]|nr:hypothetical protein [Brachymonas sp.]
MTFDALKTKHTNTRKPASLRMMATSRCPGKQAVPSLHWFNSIIQALQAMQRPHSCCAFVFCLWRSM